MIHFTYILRKNGFKESASVRAERFDECGKQVEKRRVFEKHMKKCDLWAILFKTHWMFIASRCETGDAGSSNLPVILYQESFPYDGRVNRHLKKINEKYRDEIGERNSEVELVNPHSISKQLERIGDEFSGQIIITVKDGKGITITTTEGQTATVIDGEEWNVEQGEKEAKRSLTTTQAAEYLGISIGTLQNWRSKKESFGPPFVKVGRSVRYDPLDLQRWRDERRKQSE